jgi:hypothetical protein
MYKPQWRPKRFSSHRNDQFFPGLGGNSLLDCVVFGRVAGKAACKYTFGKDERLGKNPMGPWGSQWKNPWEKLWKAEKYGTTLEIPWKKPRKTMEKCCQHIILAMIYGGSLKHIETL